MNEDQAACRQNVTKLSIDKDISKIMDRSDSTAEKFDPS